MHRADAIIVLGCRVTPSGEPTPPLARRSAAGARAYFEGLAPLVLASGGKRWGAHLEASIIGDELARAGVPTLAILKEVASLTTLENAIFSRRLLPHAPRAFIVTCPWHMPRAIAAFRAAGVEALPYPTHEPPSPPWLRAYRGGREVLSRCLDVAALRVGRAVSEGRTLS